MQTAAVAGDSKCEMTIRPNLAFWRSYVCAFSRNGMSFGA